MSDVLFVPGHYLVKKIKCCVCQMQQSKDYEFQRNALILIYILSFYYMVTKKIQTGNMRERGV